MSKLINATNAVANALGLAYDGRPFMLFYDGTTALVMLSDGGRVPVLANDVPLRVGSVAKPVPRLQASVPKLVKPLPVPTLKQATLDPQDPIGDPAGSLMADIVAGVDGEAILYNLTKGQIGLDDLRREELIALALRLGADREECRGKTVKQMRDVVNTWMAKSEPKLSPKPVLKQLRIPGT